LTIRMQAGLMRIFRQPSPDNRETHQYDWENNMSLAYVVSLP